ncbi:MAG: hypothetical protein QOJ20_3599 [Mycobacterium sp.]|jgi:nucleoside-diphosphate-sugar epimerase|nr:hypothetical protein [Mycobacterium sp.]MDT5282404.1 hypothetical protein [Mycobacterium sp.]
MRVIITGASGNVGTALLRILPAEHDVVGAVRRPGQCHPQRLAADPAAASRHSPHRTNRHSNYAPESQAY